ncbi:hypothetical protein D3C84_955240 [compost metagenome]
MYHYVEEVGAVGFESWFTVVVFRGAAQGMIVDDLAGFEMDDSVRLCVNGPFAELIQYAQLT